MEGRRGVRDQESPTNGENVRFLKDESEAGGGLCGL